MQQLALFSSVKHYIDEAMYLTLCVSWSKGTTGLYKSDVALPSGQHLDVALEQFYPFMGLYTRLVRVFMESTNTLSKRYIAKCVLSQLCVLIANNKYVYAGVTRWMYLFLSGRRSYTYRKFKSHVYVHGFIHC